MALQRQKREQDLKEQRETERNSGSPSRKKAAAAASGSSDQAVGGSLLCARKSNKKKKIGSPFKRGKQYKVPSAEL